MDILRKIVQIFEIIIEFSTTLFGGAKEWFFSYFHIGQVSFIMLFSERFKHGQEQKTNTEKNLP